MLGYFGLCIDGQLVVGNIGHNASNARMTLCKWCNSFFPCSPRVLRLGPLQL